VGIAYQRLRLQRRDPLGFLAHQPEEYVREWE
jgi:hypothetical protein